MDRLALEQQLIQKSLAGSTDAFSELVRLHQAAVRAYVARYVRGRDVVADIAQESFLSAHRGLGSYGGEAPFRLWLLGIARRAVADFLREELRRREQGGLDQTIAEWQTEWVEADEGSLAEHDQEIAALRACLRQLPRENAQMVTAFYFKSQTSAEIARRLGRREGAVRMALLRIRQALRACVEARMTSGSA